MLPALCSVCIVQTVCQISTLVSINPIATLRGEIDRLSCSYGNVFGHKDYHHWFTSGWAFIWYHYCSINGGIHTCMSSCQCWKSGGNYCQPLKGNASWFPVTKCWPWNVNHSVAFVCSSHLWNSQRYTSVFRMKLQQTVHLEMISSMTVTHRVLKVFMIAPSLSLTLSLVRQMIETKTEGNFWFVELFPSLRILLRHQQGSHCRARN